MTPFRFLPLIVFAALSVGLTGFPAVAADRPNVIR